MTKRFIPWVGFKKSTRPVTDEFIRKLSSETPPESDLQTHARWWLKTKYNARLSWLDGENGPVDADEPTGIYFEHDEDFVAFRLQWVI